MCRAFAWILAFHYLMIERMHGCPAGVRGFDSFPAGGIGAVLCATGNLILRNFS